MLEVRVLGELELRRDGEPVEPPPSRRARSLLGLLALDRRPHARAELASRFWPDVLDESARTSLRSALTALRRAVGPDADRYLVATRERAGLSDDVTVDAAAFVRLVAADRLEEAMSLWRGDLLAGLDDDWVLVARDEWRAKALEVLGALAARDEAAGDIAAALVHARRMIALDPLAEEGQRTLVDLLDTGGDRAAALAAYNRYAERLRTELGVAPSPATRRLAARLREPDAAAADASPGDASGVGADVPPAGTATVTLLFTDLVGSTRLLDARGDDEAEQLRRTHFGILREVALSHAGREVKTLGDGLMVAFGSCVDAAGCAVGIQQAVERHNRREEDERLAVRIGVHAGEAIHDKGDYFGTPVVVARRLCDLAAGGEILTTDVVRALVGSRGGFAFEPVGALELKGFADRVPACRLDWAPVGRQRIPLPGELALERDALVGREHELGHLEAAWRRALDARPGVVLVAGEPGIGKTRLVAELCRRAHAEGATVLLGRSTEEALAPHQPFVEALGHYVASCPADELLLQVGTSRAVLARLVPELGDVSARTGAEGESDRYALFDAVAALLREAARSRPTILVLDDLHWADPSSLLLLRHIARTLGDAPLLVLGTYREIEMHEDDPLTAAMAELRRARRLTRLPLEGLAPAAVGELLRNRGVELHDDDVRALAARTEGNPFFVEEVVRQPEPALDAGVPESVKDLVLRRLRRLDDPARAALAAAAVLGAEFELAVLERVTGTDGDTLLQTMDDALAARALVETPGAVGRYGFAHALIRETVYEQLSATRRARLHLRAGEALEALFAGRLDEQAPALARHFAQAGDPARSLEYEVRAARAAARVQAPEQAIAHFDAALALAAPHDTRVGVLLFERGWQQHLRGELTAAMADAAAALEIARATGDRRLMAETLDELAYAQKTFDVRAAQRNHREALALAGAIDDAALQVRILTRLSLLLANQLDLAGAVSLAERALELARRRETDRERTLAIDALKFAALQLGELDLLELLTGELAELERRNGDLWYLQWSLMEGAFAPLGRAEWDRASQRLDEALAVSMRVADTVARPLIHDAACWLARSRGDLAAALAEGRRAAALTAPGEQGPWGAWTRASLGWALLDLRAVPEAIAVLEEGMADAELATDRFRVAGHLAWAHALAGDDTGAQRAAAEARGALEELAVPPDGAFLFGFGATVALARAQLRCGGAGDVAPPLRDLRAAARRTGWREAEAGAALVLGLAGDEAALADAAGLAAVHGLPAVEWEACAALGRSADSRAAVERLAASAGDDRLAAGLLEAAHG
jgi:class 3 adenylate cyclase/tetratricopeptide (TPR) repeat protein